MTSSTADSASLGEHNFDTWTLARWPHKLEQIPFLLAAIGKVAMNDWTHP